MRPTQVIRVRVKSNDDDSDVDDNKEARTLLLNLVLVAEMVVAEVVAVTEKRTALATRLIIMVRSDLIND